MLPCHMQPFAELQARYPAAVERVWNVNPDTFDAEADRPGLHPANVFDFQDGTRLIVSRERGIKFATRLPGIEVLHVSGSATSGTLIEATMRTDPDRGMRTIERHAKDLTGNPRLRLAFFTPG